MRCPLCEGEFPGCSCRFQVVEIPVSARPLAAPDGKFYVRRERAPFIPRRFLPFRAFDAGVGSVCLFCGMPVLAGEEPALWPVGPEGRNVIARQLGAPEWNEHAAIVHWICAQGKEQP